MKRFLTVISFAFLLLTPVCLQPVVLSLNLIKGNEYRQSTNANVSVVQSINGQEIKINMIVTGTVTFHINSVSDSGYDIKARYNKLGLSINMPQGSMEYSSELDKANDVISKVLANMKNIDFDLKMSKEGTIKEVKNIEALWESSINTFDLTEEQKEQIKQQMMKAYGPESMKGSIEMVTAIYPGRPIAIGEKWTSFTKLQSGMAADVNTEYELAEVTMEYAILKGNSKIQTEDKDAYIESNGMPVKYDLTGTMTSEIKVDKNTGWVISAKMNQEIGGKAIIGGNPQMPEGMSIPMNIISETIISN